MQAGKLRNKVALVTGASSGIGEATAEALANDGADVVLAARRIDRLKSLADRLQKTGAKAIAIQTDVTDEDDVSSTIARVLQDCGRLDILVAAAGIGVAAPFQNTTSSEYRDMISVNYLGLLYSIRAVLPVMKRQSDGHIVIVSSGTGRYVHPSTVYSGTKHAVSAMAESLRREIGKEWIRVTTIEPGAVKTEFTANMREDVRKSVEQRLGDMEQLEGSDIAAAIIYAVTLPRRVNVNILTIYPTQQA